MAEEENQIVLQMLLTMKDQLEIDDDLELYQFEKLNKNLDHSYVYVKIEAPYVISSNDVASEKFLISPNPTTSKI